MARPRKEGLDYFPLDIHFDEKIKAIESLHKNDGFVWIIKFWQKAYSNNDGHVPLGDIFGVIHAENCRITPQKHLDILQDCLKIGLLIEVKPGLYSSNGVQKRLDEVIKDRINERKRKLVAHIPPENHPLRGESKVKESKEKKRDVFIPPTIEMVSDFKAEITSPVDPQYFINHYAAKGWMIGKSKMKDWKASFRNAATWERFNNGNHRASKLPPEL